MHITFPEFEGELL